jgi:hypothetical protein
MSWKMIELSAYDINRATKTERQPGSWDAVGLSENPIP